MKFQWKIVCLRRAQNSNIQFILILFAAQRVLAALFSPSTAREKKKKTTIRFQPTHRPIRPFSKSFSWCDLINTMVIHLKIWSHQQWVKKAATKRFRETRGLTTSTSSSFYIFWSTQIQIPTVDQNMKNGKAVRAKEKIHNCWHLLM